MRDSLRAKFSREDRFSVPLDALREILFNAVMHRDYSDYSGYVALVVFDDRIEMQSHGLLPQGVTLEQLSGPHRSKLRNPLIAEAFRTGAVEVWGRGTNRVIAMCEKHGTAPPVFQERQGFLIVTFKARLVAEGTVAASGVQSIRVMNALSRGALSARALADAIGMRSKTGALKRTLSEMLSEALIEYTLPEKRNSRLQKYRLTPEGKMALKEREVENGK